MLFLKCLFENHEFPQSNMTLALKTSQGFILSFSYIQPFYDRSQTMLEKLVTATNNLYWDFIMLHYHQKQTFANNKRTKVCVFVYECLYFDATRVRHVNADILLACNDENSKLFIVNNRCGTMGTKENVCMYLCTMWMLLECVFVCVTSNAHIFTCSKSKYENLKLFAMFWNEVGLVSGTWSIRKLRHWLNKLQKKISNYS